VFKPLVDIARDDFDRVMAVNVRGVFLMTRAAVRGWLEREYAGVVVNVASNLALVGTPSGSVYCASKGAVVAFTKAVARETGPQGICVNALCPGATATEFNRAFRAEPGVLEAWETQTPLRLPGRDFLAVPDQIAPAVVFLASDESNYMTGTELVVDGGWNCA
jgi:cyclopentanol dehydrogenase